MVARSEKSKLEIYHYYTEHGIHDSIKHFDLSKTQIRRICRATREKYKLPKRDNSDSYRKYTLDKNYFEVIDTEEKAYWLGFIGADGSINLGERRLDVGLKRSDRHHLSKLSKALGSNRPIEDQKKYDVRYDCYRYSSRVCFNSSKLISDLAKYNIVENKTDNFIPNVNFNKNLHHHFWRGFCDGDGSLKLNKYKNGYITRVIEIYGTKDTCKVYKKFLLDTFSLKFNINSQSSIFKVSCQRDSESVKIAKYLYKDCSISLDRKQKLAESWYKQQEQL